jgi:hypothetical protein
MRPRESGVRRRLNLSTASVVTLTVAGFYLWFTVLALGLHNGDPLWFVWVGERFADLDPNGRGGYDGQFVFYLATYGREGIAHLDNEPYRLQRIGMPVLVRLLSLGIPALVPWVMIAVGLAAVVLTTAVLARWLDRQNLSPWYALTYSLYLGTCMAFSRALIEPLALCLAAWGCSLWSRDKVAWAVLALGLAPLAKETMLIFVIGIACAELVHQRLWRAVSALVAALPMLAWQGVLYAAFGVFPIISGPSLEWIPLRGIVPHVTPEPGRLSSLLFVGLPALFLLFLSGWYLWKERGRSPGVWWLLLQSVLVVSMPLHVYQHVMHSARNAGGLVLSVVFAMPLMARPLRPLFTAGWVLPTLVWLVPILRWAPWLSVI